MNIRKKNINLYYMAQESRKVSHSKPRLPENCITRESGVSKCNRCCTTRDCHFNDKTKRSRHLMKQMRADNIAYHALETGDVCESKYSCARYKTNFAGMNLMQLRKLKNKFHEIVNARTKWINKYYNKNNPGCTSCDYSCRNHNYRLRSAKLAIEALTIAINQAEAAEEVSRELNEQMEKSNKSNNNETDDGWSMVTRSRRRMNSARGSSKTKRIIKRKKNNKSKTKKLTTGKTKKLRTMKVRTRTKARTRAR
tara:strand:- start:291 stop:1049 length:759 start_codon:yes stop_codon:yes gene_type:complete